MMRHSLDMTRNQRTNRRDRRAMQLLELVISLAIAAILMAGISGAIMISKRTLDSVSSQASSAASAQGGIQLLQNDLREARQVDNRTATSIEMKVPDRDSDGVLESVHYRWSATAGPLETSSDGVTWRALTPNLSDMQLNLRSRQPQSIEPPAPLDDSGHISYANMSTNSRSDWARNLTIPAPAGSLKGDACVAVLSACNNPGNIKSDGNWIKVSQTSPDNNLNLAFWYTTDVPPNTTFSWGNAGQAIGCIVHLTGNSSNPYVGIANLSGLGQLPAPSLGGSHPGQYVIRALAGIGPGVPDDLPSVVNHSPILLRQVDIPYSYSDLTLAVVGQSLPGSTIDQANFQISPLSTISCTGTVALRP
ncbi:MAG: PulJ/GspJ family protein [Aureliella sp.]